MKTVTLQSLRIRFLTIISIVSIVGSLFKFFAFYRIGREVELIHYFIVAISIVTLLMFRFSARKDIVVKLNPILMVVAYAFSHYLTLAEHGYLLPYEFFLFPLFASFLVGSTGGFLLSLINLAIPLIISGGNIGIFGESAPAFLAVYSIQVVAILLFERVHDYLLNHIRKVSSTDPLTGLENTSGFMYNMTKTTERRESFFLILSDFDYFSRINTNLGYTMCDKILVRAGELLSEDGKVKHIARYYGDQFSILFLGSREEIVRYIEQKQEAIRGISNELNIDVELTISSGIIHYPGDCDSVENLMANVELALREAKKVDRDAYHFFDSNTLKEQRENDTIQRTLHDALVQDQIEVHFQPKVNCDSKKVSGMEALIRWNHPELGYLQPPRFIAVAEQCGLIVEVGEFVITRALKHLQRCQKEGATDLTVSINISPIHLLAKDFLGKLEESCRQYAIAPSDVYLEITENLLLEGDVSLHLKRVQEAGFKLSLDDFGTGYSSLNYLRQFSFDELKIDKCFTDGLLRDSREIEMFETILSIATIFKMKTVVEGVETEEQVNMISSYGRCEIQGWYYSKALSSDDFVKWLPRYL